MIDYLFLICTSKNKNYINNLLISIDKMHKSNKKIKLIIVENSQKKSHFKILKNFSKKSKIRYIYALEKNLGIPFARNKALSLVKKIKYKNLCFFDDDCKIDKNWLLNIIKLKKKLNPDIITGPQIPEKKNIYLDLLTREGTDYKKVKWAATNNVVIKQGIIEKTKIKFLKELNNFGGSDQLFFINLNQKGYSIIWCNTAKVYESFDKKRSNVNWFLKRNFRYGLSSFIIYTNGYGFFNGFLKVIQKLIYEILISFLYLLMIPINFKIFSLKFLMYFVRFVGTLLGIFQIKLKKYI